MQEERLVASEPRSGDRITVQRNQHECWGRAGELTQARGGRKKTPLLSDPLPLRERSLRASQQHHTY